MKQIYLDDSYQRDFDAIVQLVSDGRIILDQTAFYPQSGGQPSDLGRLYRGGDVFEVQRVEPSNRRIYFLLEDI